MDRDFKATSNAMKPRGETDSLSLARAGSGALATAECGLCSGEEASTDEASPGRADPILQVRGGGFGFVTG